MLRKTWFTRQHRGRLCLAIGQDELTCTRETAMKAWLYCSCPILHYPVSGERGGVTDSNWRWMNKIIVHWDLAKNRPVLVTMIVYFRMSWQESERENTMLTNCDKAVYLYSLSSKWSSDNEHSCRWMSNLLSCSAHLKSTATTRSQMQRLHLWSQGYPHQWFNEQNQTFISAFPWGAHADVAGSHSQCHFRKRRSLWHCISMCFPAAINSAGGPPVSSASWPYWPTEP